jgi:hypothetical protein
LARLALTNSFLSVQREAAEYLLSHYPDVASKMTVEEYLHERNHMQEELFRKVEPMTGAVALVRGLVSDPRWTTGLARFTVQQVHGSWSYKAGKHEAERYLSMTLGYL